MALVPLRPLLEATDKYHFAQGAFNVNAVAQAMLRCVLLIWKKP